MSNNSHLLETPDVIINPYRFASSGSPGTANLVGWWGLDDLNDDHASYDLTDGGTITYATGKQGNAASFDGTTDYLSNSAFPNDIHQSDFSVSVWVNADTLRDPTTNGIIGQFGSTNPGEWHWGMFAAAGTIYFRTWNTSSTAFSAVSNSTLGTGSWVHLVGVKNSSGVITLYVDGVAQTTTGDDSGETLNTADQDLAIGVILDDVATRGWDGLIDEVGIFDDELSTDEVSWLYNSGSGRQYSDL